MKKALLIFLILFTFSGIFIYCTDSSEEAVPDVLIRVDDIGMNHAVNMALKQMAEKKIPLSASVMFACPWHREAVEILKKNPHISVGVHLTLNSEWRYY